MKLTSDRNQKSCNIGILTTFQDYLLPFLLREISSCRNINFFLIISKTKKNNDKSLKKFQERTGDNFLKHKLDFFNQDNLVPSYFVESHNSKKLYKIIKNQNIEFLYNSGTPNKINSETIEKVKGVINIHPGVLPIYRGCTCPEWTLFHNDPLGVTAHFMNSEYDSGPIIKVKYLRFKKEDIKKYEDVRIKLCLLTIKLAKFIFNQISTQNFASYHQNTKKAKYHNVIETRLLSDIKEDILKKNYRFNKKNLLYKSA
tara:strand:- start:466 stop:1236 length:771 start_codon:yes stop_codon:yes gene_type:complete